MTWSELGRGPEAGGSGIFPKADDLTRFAQMLLNGGTLGGKRLLGRKAIDLMMANHALILPNNQAATRQKGFGFGVEVTTEPERLAVPSSVGPFG